MADRLSVAVGIISLQSLSLIVFERYAHALREQIEVFDESLTAVRTCFSSGNDTGINGTLQEDLQQCLRNVRNTVQIFTKRPALGNSWEPTSLQVDRSASEFYYRHNIQGVMRLETFVRGAHLALEPNPHAGQHINDPTPMKSRESYTLGTAPKARWKEMSSLLPHNRTSPLHLFPRFLTHPSRNVYVLCCIVYGLALLSFLQHRKHDRYQSVFLRVGVIIGFVLGLISSLHNGDIAGFGIFTPGSISAVVTLSAILHGAIPGWRRGNYIAPSSTPGKERVVGIATLMAAQQQRDDVSVHTRNTKKENGRAIKDADLQQTVQASHNEK
ncbi:MAG: hypothetical protein M1822_006042 [Bathelium mastoideum]|nr:MAG: hypothetical protein M1822_006042 [Bathelium mastoideum]